MTDILIFVLVFIVIPLILASIANDYINKGGKP